MRAPPNALTIFGTTGAIGASRAAISTALAGLNGKRLAIGTAPTAARPKVKRLRVESSPIKIICRPYPASTQILGQCGVSPALFGHKHGSNLHILAGSRAFWGDAGVTRGEK